MSTSKSSTAKRLTRRSFLRGSLAGAAAVSWTAQSWARVKGANESINAGVVGFRGRGGSHISSIRTMQQGEQGVRLAALCDVDSKVLGAATAKFSVPGYNDVRKMIEDKNLDVVAIATPNHWHALAAIWAIQAGKDVYVEKPVSHNVWEGRQLVNAARKYKKIVQTGTQSRSSSGIREATQWVQAGNLGKILIARGLCYKPRGSIGKVADAQKVPSEVDFDLWCGPAPKDEMRRKNLHYDWHWIWNYGNGDLGNQGIHQMDIARWFLGPVELSPLVFSVGGRLGYEDDGETPNTQYVWHGYEKAPLIFEVRGLPSAKGAKGMDSYHGAGVGVVIECEGGEVVVPNYNGAVAKDKTGKEIKKWSGAEDHFANFIKAVRSRKSEDLNADILEGHISSALCHTGNVSYQLGKTASVADIRKTVSAHRGGEETLNRMVEHLAKNEVDLGKTPLTIGAVLKMDPKTEKFIGNAAADKLLTREYRKPYVVPEIV
ncbi:MAG: Gfo/Idh/MocA family oxidoreductase [Pedosphaera sp.]|nr:Gfo/Idh/MocA family oxidoreductase [Pedosphaera sp.]MSU43112.1 Gfo/Idh/MocA family oxidoreductase [Pedosphaera sp.]